MDEHVMLTEADVRRIMREEVSAAVANFPAADAGLSLGALGLLSLKLRDEAEQAEQDQLSRSLVPLVQEQILSEVLDLLCAHGLLRKRDVAEAVGRSQQTSPSVGESDVPTVGERPVAGESHGPSVTGPAEGGDR